MPLCKHFLAILNACGHVITHALLANRTQNLKNCRLFHWPFISAVSALPFMFLCQIKNLKYNIRTNLIRMATKCFLSQQKSRIKALYGNSDPFSRWKLRTVSWMQSPYGGLVAIKWKFSLEISGISRSEISVCESIAII